MGEPTFTQSAAKFDIADDLERWFLRSGQNEKNQRFVVKNKKNRDAGRWGWGDGEGWDEKLLLLGKSAIKVKITNHYKLFICYYKLLIYYKWLIWN